MKTLCILCLAFLAGSASIWAQGPGSARPLLDFRKKKVDDETKAKAVDAAKTIIKSVPDDLKDKAKELLISPDTADMRQKALQAAQTMIQGVGGATKSAEAPPTTVAPAPTAASPVIPVVEKPPAPPPPTGPQPKPLRPLNLDEAPKTSKGQIVITAQKSAFFDANTGHGIYIGDVKASHPQMRIECEELEIWMAKQEGGLVGTSKPKASPLAAKDSDILAPPKKDDEGPPIEKADARGPMVTVEKRTPEGELQIGHCKHLIYDGKTGNSTLLEWPQVQAGNKLHKATEAGCVMIIDRGGKLTTTGGHTTIILQGDEATAPSAPTN